MAELGPAGQAGEQEKKMHRQWKQGQATWEEYRDAARLCGVRVRKDKAQLNLDFERSTKKDKKGFCRYINQKREVQESILSLVNSTGRLVIRGKEKSKVLNFFASVFTSDCSTHSF